jgi:hypothetical protein
MVRRLDRVDTGPIRTIFSKQAEVARDARQTFNAYAREVGGMN